MSFTVKVDSRTEEYNLRISKELRKLPRIMMDVANWAAAEEHVTKRYVNRTHNLINSTESQLLKASADAVSVAVVMDADYASYLTDKGFSDFRDIGDETIELMTEVLEDIF